MVLSNANSATPLVTRFAPSPTGYLHLGHCLSAIFVWGVARALGAKVILRIEDHDSSRSRKQFEDEILQDLAWLGFESDMGVTSSHKPSLFRQSDQRARYDAVLADLKGRRLCFACECSRKQIQDRTQVNGDELFYNGTCRHKNLPFANNLGTRFVTEDGAITFRDLWLDEQWQNPAQQCGDFLIKDRHNQYTYQFCVAVDDVDQRVNLIIRGQDLTPSTARQILLKKELGQHGANIRYLHHPLIKDKDGQKFSKRFASEAIATHRKDRADSCSVLRSACEQSGIDGLKDARDRSEIADFFRQLTTDFLL